MMKYHYLLLLMVFFSFYSHSQDSLVVKGIVLNKQTKDSISNVKVKIKFDNQVVDLKSNSKGIFYFKVQTNKQYELGFTHQVFMNTSDQLLEKSRKYLDTVKRVFEMLPIKINEIEVVTIRPEGVPEKIFTSEYVSVADFEVLPDGSYILLTYPKTLKKGSDVVLYDGRNIISTIPIDDHAVELRKDFRGNPHVICEKSVYGIYISNAKIGIAKLEKEYFMKYLAPILDSNYTKYYLSDFNKDYPSMNYYSFDQLDSTYSKIVTITDDFMMELYRAEYKWVDVRTKLWAKQKEQETGIDAQIWVGANYFTQSVYYKQLYAPMFHRNDTLFIFDYYKDLMYRFNNEGKMIDSISIYHHYFPKQTGWKKHLIQDRVTGQIYALFDVDGYSSIRRINPNSGELMESIPLKYRYVDKIEIYDNALYYIYRPFESVQKKYLFKEKIPIQLSKAIVLDGDLIQD